MSGSFLLSQFLQKLCMALSGPNNTCAQDLQHRNGYLPCLAVYHFKGCVNKLCMALSGLNKTCAHNLHLHIETVICPAWQCTILRVLAKVTHGPVWPEQYLRTGPATSKRLSALPGSVPFRQLVMYGPVWLVQHFRIIDRLPFWAFIN